MATATTTAPTTQDDVWGMEVPKAGTGGDYVACPAGNHPATIVGLFDIGHQAGTDMKGLPIDQHQLVLVFELVKKRPDGKPFVLGRLYTFSMHEKANFYKDACSITGVKFKEGDKFNPLSLAGVPVMVNVTNSGNGEKIYHNVGSVAQFPEGFPAPDATLHPVSWSVRTGVPFPEGLDWLPFVYGKSIKELAEGSSEVRRPGGKPTTAPVVTSADEPESPF